MTTPLPLTKTCKAPVKSLIDFRLVELTDVWTVSHQTKLDNETLEFKNTH